MEASIRRSVVTTSGRLSLMFKRQPLDKFFGRAVDYDDAVLATGAAFRADNADNFGLVSRTLGVV